MISQKPDFKLAYVKANELLVANSTIREFPYSSVDLIHDVSNIKCCTYGKAKERGVDIRDFGSDSAVSFHFHNKSIIFYNETKPEAHNNFSLLHELGHNLLEHDFECHDLMEYGRYEVETNFFAAQLLMPDQLIRCMQSRGARIDAPFLQKAFGVSQEAAEKRISTLNRVEPAFKSYAEREFDDIILNRYKPFMDAKFPEPSKIDWELEYEQQNTRNRWY